MKKASVPQSPYKITCSDVPQELLLRQPAKLYFSQFGKILRVILRPKSGTCIIEYENEESVELAISLGGNYEGMKFNITRDAKPVKKKRVKKVQDPDWIPDPEVQAELEAMGAPFVRKKYNLRPEHMSVDESSLSVVAKKSVKSKWKSVLKATPTGSNEKIEFLKSIKQRAITAEDKFKVLDARDKLIRISSRRFTDLSSASRTVGTCPDMCPEKERLLRDIQRQVAVYEQEYGGKAMNHILAVKQYSRSSADQEVPLPHELRPVKVLKTTMRYLAYGIMNLGDSADVNFAEWYHFLWDRTRGIRKDITQQELCCEESVDLVEQCARFHIHCSARLVAEDPSVFDQKINTENLTKCLQTLKYMYHDLRLKNVECPNESEFRAYIILLNLNDGNFMWEVQQLRPEIQKSKEVNFALQVYSSLDKNNYVKFFKLVRSATYLNACLLLRYFVQVRLNALQTILKSFSPRSPHRLYPVAELTRILAFESDAAAVDFLKYHGLSLNEDDSQFVLDRRSFYLPELPYVLDRAIKVVEVKQTCSVGQVVTRDFSFFANEYSMPVPISSFDEFGFFKAKNVLRDLGICEKDLSAEESKESPEKPQIQDIKPIEPENIVKPQDIFGSKLFSNVQDQEIERRRSPMFSTDTVDKPSDFWSPNPFQTTIIFNTPKETERGIFASTKTEGLPKIDMGFHFSPISTKKKRDEEFLIKKQEEEKEKKRRELEEILRRKVEEELMNRQKLQEEFERSERVRKEKEENKRLREELERQRKLEEKRLKLEKRKKNAKIKKAVVKTIDFLLTAVEENFKQDRLEEIRQKIARRKANLYFKKWRANAKIVGRKRKALHLSPMFLSHTVEEDAREFNMESKDLTLEMMKRYKVGQSEDVPLYKEEKAGKIDVHNLVYDVLMRRNHELGGTFRNELFWMVSVASADNVNCEKSMKSVQEILDDCFNCDDVFIQKIKTGNRKITYCVNSGDFEDSNGIIFIADHLDERTQNYLYVELLKSGENFPRPVAVILQEKNVCDDFLAGLLEDGVITNYKIQQDSFNATSLTSMIKESLIFLAANREEVQNLELDTLRSFLGSYQSTEIWKRITSFSRWNSNYRKCLRDPEIAVDIFNDNLEKIKELVTNENRFAYQNFPQVLKNELARDVPDFLPCDYKYFPHFWKTKEYNENLTNTIDRFKLPKYTNPWPPKNKETLEKNLSDYCKMIFAQPEKPFYKIMGVILKNTNPDKISNVFWPEIMEILAGERIKQAKFEIHSNFSHKSIFNENFVVYDQEDLQKYRDNNWYYINYPPIKKVIHNIGQKPDNIQERTTQLDVEADLDLDEMLNKITMEMVENQGERSQRKKEVDELEKLMKDLGDSISVQRKINEKLNENLKNALDT